LLDVIANAAESDGEVKADIIKIIKAKDTDDTLAYPANNQFSTPN